MRWWLALVFAAIAALTALLVSEVFLQRAENAFRARAQDIAAGAAVGAAQTVRTASERSGRFEGTLKAESERRRLPLFVFGADGRPLSPLRSSGISFGRVRSRSDALRTALEGRRYVKSYDKGDTIVIGLPLHFGNARALVAVASGSELKSDLGIVQDEIIPAALVAVLAGALVGLLVAILISLRLRKVAKAAAEIAEGNFERRLSPRFHDEVGDLAVTMDKMRERLRESFATLESERDRLRRLIERLHDGVIGIDVQLKVIVANEVAAQMLGTRLEEGDELPGFWADFALHDFARELFAPSARLAETRVRPAQDRTYSVVGVPAHAPSGGAVLVLADISERERRERAEREFVANAAHELRTPLTAISSAIEALSAGAKDDPGQREQFLAVIERQASRLGRLVRALLMLARAQTRQQPIRLESVELRSLLDGVAANLSTPEGTDVEVRCSAHLAALGQRDLLEQIVSNLATNAARHADGGRVSLSASASAEDAVVIIEVSDTGPGIERQEQERIFDRFYSGDRQTGEGFGLGLAIVNEAVRALGGTIEVDSMPGAGTTLRVRLSAVEETLA